MVADSGAGGATFATDDIAGVHYPISKLAYGALDSATVVATGVNALPIQDGGNALTVDWAGTAPPIGAGLEATALRVTVATDSTGLLSVDDNGGSLTVDSANLVTLAGAVAGTEMQVDVVAALPAGTNAIGKLAANSGVDIGDVDVTSVIPGTGATNLGKAIDAVGGATDTGVPPLAVRDDALGALTPIEGDYVALRTDANGALWTHDDALDAALGGSELQVDVVGALPTGSNTIGTVNVGTFPDNEPFNAAQWGGTASAGGSGAATAGSPRVIAATDSPEVTALQIMDDWDNAASDGASVSGDVAHDSPDAGEPIKLGAKAVSSLESQTAVAANDRTNVFADLDGQLLVKPYTTFGDLLSERVSDTAGTSTAFTTFGVGGAAVRNYVTAITVHNAHATTNGYVDIRDGSAGAVLWTIPAPATGGAHVTFSPPLRQPTANTALAYDVSAAITTIYISVAGFQSSV